MGDFFFHGGFTAFLFSNGVFTPLGLARGSATDINERGQIVGFAGLNPAAFLLDNGVVTDLAPVQSFAQGMNERGQIAGAAPFGANNTHAFLWEDGVISDLGTLGGAFSDALAVNDEGVAVGSSADEQGNFVAFRWAGGMMTSLGTLGGTFSSATDINNRGQIVGTAQDEMGRSHAFLFEGGVMKDLGLGSASAINDQGDIVGEGGLLVRQGVRVHLNLVNPGGGPLPTIASLNDINARGQIAACGVTDDGRERGFLLVPVATDSLAKPVASR